MSNINITGLNELNSNIQRLQHKAEEVVKREIADIALDLAGKSSESAPVDLGDLRGDLASPKKESELAWKVGSSLPYCAKQHESTWFNHPKGGGAKFIENPFNQNKEKYVKEIKKAIQRELR